jgi:hypothetical protein
MVICLDMVGRKSMTVGRADDEGDPLKGECLLPSNTIASPSLQQQKMKQIRSFLRETLEKHISLPVHSANL